MKDTPDERSIRAAREQFNVAIAAHDANALDACWARELVVIPGAGGLLQGAAAVKSAFTSYFADPEFVAFARNTSEVQISADRKQAAERGEWIGTWARGAGVEISRGCYTAAWERNGTRWMLRSELFVTLRIDSSQPAMPRLAG